MNATMKQVVAASKQGIIKTPNQPTYSRLLVLVVHEVKLSQVSLSGLALGVRIVVDI